MFKKGQTYFKNLAVFTMQDFEGCLAICQYYGSRVKRMWQILLGKGVQWAKALRSNRKVARSTPPETCRYIIMRLPITFGAN